VLAFVNENESAREERNKEPGRKLGFFLEERKMAKKNKDI
jgi:hypothetical protein